MSRPPSSAPLKPSPKVATEPLAEGGLAATRRALPGLFAALLGTVAVCLLLGSTPLRLWAERIAATQEAPRLAEAAASWDEAMRWLGLTRLYDEIRAEAREVEARRFGPR